MGNDIDPSRSYAAREASWIHGFETSDEQINLKIYSAFESVKSFPFKRIIFQFWQAVADGGRPMLESFRNVYAVSPFNRQLRDKYRPCCMKYQYSIEEGDNHNPAWIISSGPFSAAFLNHFPQVVLDLRVHQGSPLAVCGLECDLTCCVMLPIFYSGSSECVGVVECSMNHPGLLLPVFNELKRELERVGLRIYHVQGSWPYKTPISGDLEAAKIEIEQALKIASELHSLTLGQVWIHYEGENDDHESNTSQLFLVKLGGHSVCSDGDPLSSIKDFYDKFDVISLKKGEGLVGRTLETHQPHLCKNIYKLGDNRGVLALLSANAKSKCASFVICLRSIHTKDLDYAFEFFWPCGRNHFIMLEALLVTLSKYLPSFKLASGEQIRNALLVVDVERFSSSSKILPSEALNETITLMCEKRKFIDLYPLTSIRNPEGGVDDGNDDNDDDDDDDDLAILATYRNETLLFYLPSSSTFENVMVKLKKEFELDPSRTYKVEYEVSPNQWSNLACLESCRGMELVKLRVLSNVREVGWRWITN